MNARPEEDSARTAAAKPQTAARAHCTALADLAFGSLSRTGASEGAAGRHLAFLSVDSLELDLTDPMQRRLGDYELLEKIGEGGMGVVYRAHQQGLDREVAVKLLSAGPWASREYVERFRREAQNAARMQHPNIVAIYEVGSAEELHFFSMRMIRGGSLAALLRERGRLDPRHAAQLLRTIAEAVDYAHRLGVLHLDLKPANVMLDENGAPHVADFGLARRLDSALAADSDEVSGTPSYMAPEQASPRTRRITRATDIWGLGAILYELVTGEPPFLGASPQDTLKLVVEGTLRNPRRHAPNLPRDLEAIIVKCMARDVSERYASGRDLADDLNRFLEGRAVRARPLNLPQRLWRWGQREPRLALAVLLAASALVAGIVATTKQWRRAEANSELAHTELWNAREADALRLMEAGAGWTAAPLLLANIREMEASGAADRAAGSRRRLGILENANPQLVDAWSDPPNAVSIAFSADGKRLATSAQGDGIRIRDIADGTELFRTRADEKQPGANAGTLEYLRFSDDDRTLVAAGTPDKLGAPHPHAAGMQRLDVGTRAWLIPPPQFADFENASYSADGHFAILTGRDGKVQGWSTSPWRPLSPVGTPPPLNGLAARLVAPDGSVFAQDAQAHAVVLVDMHTLAERARVPLGDFGNIAAWAFSSDSHWLALGDATGAVAVVDCATLEVLRPSPRPFFPVYSIGFSADGGWLAAAVGAGGVYLWSWPDARLLAPPFGGGGSKGGSPWAEHVVMDRPRGLLLSSDETSSTVLWQIGDVSTAADLDDAVPVTARMNPNHSNEDEAVAWDVPRGLLAMRNDQITRLERLRPAALKTGRAAPKMPETLRFDGRHLVVAHGSSVQVVDASSEQPAGAIVRVAQAPDFAELTADGATLVVVVGRMLQAYDARSGTPRFAAIALENSPAHVELSPDGRRVLAGWIRNEAQGDSVRSEQTAIYDLANGVRLAGPVALPAQAHAVTFSNDGGRVLSWNLYDLTLRDGATLAPLPGPLAQLRPRGTNVDGGGDWVRLAQFNLAHEVELVLGRPEQNPEFRTYATDGNVRSQTLSWVMPQGMLALPDRRGTVVAGMMGGASIIAADGSGQQLPELPDDSFRVVFATSPDGRWLARGRRDGAALFDLQGMVRVTTLRVALPRPDWVWQLAFSPDGNRLLARTLGGRLMVWDLSPDLRPPAAIARELELREVAETGAGERVAATPPTAAERAALRAADPGPAPAVALAKPLATVRDAPGGGIPPRDPAAPPHTLDLTPWYTFGLRETLPVSDSGGADFRWLPQGLQRLLGIDFDVRGAIGLHAALQARLPLARTAAAVDVLVASDADVDGPGKEHLANVRLDYADGSQATLPFGLARDSYYSFRSPKAPPPAQFAAWGFDARVVAYGLRHDMAFVVRVPNPHPQRPLAALTLVSAGNPAVQSSILAVSVEPTTNKEVLQ